MQGARGRNPQDQAGAPEKRADASDEQKQRAEKYEKIRRDAAIDQEREAEFMRNTDPSKISDRSIDYYTCIYLYYVFNNPGSTASRSLPARRSDVLFVHTPTPLSALLLHPLPIHPVPPYSRVP